MKYNVFKNRNLIWNSDAYKEETKDLDFLKACDFYSCKAIEESRLLKTGCFVNLVAHYGDIWIEVDKVFDTSFTTSIEVYRDKYFYKNKIRSIISADEIINEDARIIYTKNGQFGGKDGKPIEQFLRSLNTPSV